MRIAVARETEAGEPRVAATPERLSPAVSSTVTAWLLQSETSEIDVVGAVRSIFTGELVAVVWLPE